MSYEVKRYVARPRHLFDETAVIECNSEELAKTVEAALNLYHSADRVLAWIKGIVPEMEKALEENRKND